MLSAAKHLNRTAMLVTCVEILRYAQDDRHRTAFGRRAAKRGPSRVSPWLIVVVILVVYAGTGIYIVAPDERGIVLRFGQVVREADPGPGYHLPWPF